MNYWQYHDDKIKELKSLYNRVNKQTQKRLQEVFDSLNFDFESLYNVANTKTKKMVDTQIEEWQDKELLIDDFGIKAKNIKNRTRVKNNEILELLIYGAYIEEQSKIQEKELDIIKDDMNYYYQEGQKEVNKTLPPKKKKTVTEIPAAVFLTLLDRPIIRGYLWSQYLQTVTQYNAEQIYRQAVIDIQQLKELKIDSDVFQSIINKQQNAKLSINGNKTSGSVDNAMISLNNQAKAEGVYSFDDKAKVKFIAVEDNVTTKMCHSLDGQIFNVHNWNEFKRYSDTNKSVTKYKCYGLIPGLNMPPIDNHFHWCRSSITYQIPVELQIKEEYNIVEYVRKKSFTSSKKLDESIKKALNLLPNKIIQMLDNTEIIKINQGNSHYDRSNDKIYLLEDSDKYEVLHEIGHLVETKLDILKDNEYIKIQAKGLNISNINIDTIKGYDSKYQFWLDGNKFVSDEQRLVYDNDINGNDAINYTTYEFNPETLGEYFAEGFSYYFKPSGILKKKDEDLYNYIKEVLK